MKVKKTVKGKILKLRKGKRCGNSSSESEAMNILERAMGYTPIAGAALIQSMIDRKLGKRKFGGGE